MSKEHRDYQYATIRISVAEWKEKYIIGFASNLGGFFFNAQITDVSSHREQDFYFFIQ